MSLVLVSMMVSALKFCLLDGPIESAEISNQSHRCQLLRQLGVLDRRVLRLRAHRAPFCVLRDVVANARPPEDLADRGLHVARPQVNDPVVVAGHHLLAQRRWHDDFVRPWMNSQLDTRQLLLILGHALVLRLLLRELLHIYREHRRALPRLVRRSQRMGWLCMRVTSLLQLGPANEGQARQRVHDRVAGVLCVMDHGTELLDFQTPPHHVDIVERRVGEVEVVGLQMQLLTEEDAVELPQAIRYSVVQAVWPGARPERGCTSSTRTRSACRPA